MLSLSLGSADDVPDLLTLEFVSDLGVELVLGGLALDLVVRNACLEVNGLNLGAADGDPVVGDDSGVAVVGLNQGSRWIMGSRVGQANESSGGCQGEELGNKRGIKGASRNGW